MHRDGVWSGKVKLGTVSFDGLVQIFLKQAKQSSL